jgi:hypothetical protein
VLIAQRLTAMRLRKAAIHRVSFLVVRDLPTREVLIARRLIAMRLRKVAVHCVSSLAVQNLPFREVLIARRLTATMHPRKAGLHSSNYRREMKSTKTLKTNL